MEKMAIKVEEINNSINSKAILEYLINLGYKNVNLNDYEISKYSDEEIILKKKFKYPKWGDLNRISGYYITDNCSIRPATNVIANGENKNVFLTEKHAKSALAMAQISQLMPYYGSKITNKEWADYSVEKYVLVRNNNEIKSGESYLGYEFLAFHTKEQRDAFLKNNEQLVKDYLMIE